MRVLIISDVHANLAALEAVFSDAGNLDDVWSLGDIVGYGPHPNECIRLLRERDHLAYMVGSSLAVLAKGHTILPEVRMIDLLCRAPSPLVWQSSL